MHTIVVGLMTYVVDNPAAAELLELAAAADSKGDFEQASALKTSAARVESGKLSVDEVRAQIAA